MWLWMKWHCKVVHGWMVYAELAPRRSSFTWHQPCNNQIALSVHHFGGYEKYALWKSQFGNRHTRKDAAYSDIIIIILDRSCIALVSAVEETHCAHVAGWFWMKCMVYWQSIWLLHGWCHVEILPSRRKLCVRHTAMHQFTVPLHSKPHR